MPRGNKKKNISRHCSGKNEELHKAADDQTFTTISRKIAIKNTQRASGWQIPAFIGQKWNDEGWQVPLGKGSGRPTDERGRNREDTESKSENIIVPLAGGGAVDSSGTYYPDVGGGYVNPRTGHFSPK